MLLPLVDSSVDHYYFGFLFTDKPHLEVADGYAWHNSIRDQDSPDYTLYVNINLVRYLINQEYKINIRAEPSLHKSLESLKSSIDHTFLPNVTSNSFPIYVFSINKSYSKIYQLIKLDTKEDLIEYFNKII